MPTKILILESANFTVASELRDAKRVNVDDSASLESTLAEDSIRLILAPADLRGQNAAIDAFLETAAGADSGAISIAYFRKSEDCAEYLPFLDSFISDLRATGVKTFLQKGSSIYSETFFHAGGIGQKMDSCFRFAHARLSPARAIDSWAALQSLVCTGIRSLPQQGEGGTGERVDVQIGADANRVVFSVRFDSSEETALELRKSSLLETVRASCDLFEFRYFAESKKVEILGMVFAGNAATRGIEVQTVQASAALEATDDVKEYEFKNFGSLAGDAPEDKRVVKGGGFKKKFSERLASAPTPAPDVSTQSSEEIPAAAKVVVSGAASMKPQEKSAALWESKIESLESTLKQREELIAKLNKEIAEIKDPLKMNVISSIKDTQVEGLKGTIARLENELKETQTREKELMTVVDKAIQLKDEAVKRLKDYEAKLRQTQGGNNSKVVALEKALEEQKRQNKELSKRITQLMEQGKKAA